MMKSNYENKKVEKNEGDSIRKEIAEIEGHTRRVFSTEIMAVFQGAWKSYRDDPANSGVDYAD